MAARSERLLNLMQALRRRRRPVKGEILAEETGVSLRTLYRDIATLKSMGAAIDGEAGLGFQLRADYWLPPLMFTDEEIEALVLGLRTLVHGPDEDLRATADDARAKIAAVLPPDRREVMEAVGLFAIPPWNRDEQDRRLSTLRHAVRQEHEVFLHYTDKQGAVTKRHVWPVALGYTDNRQMLVAWCTLREDFRSFWVDAMLEVADMDKRYAKPRRTLLHDWRQCSNYPAFT